MPTALIVEDDPDQAQMAARLLRYRDFDSDIAPTGGEGLAMARVAEARRHPARPDAPRHLGVRGLPEA